MKVIRAAVLAAVLAAPVLVGAAGPAAADPPPCVYTANTLTADNLQEDGQEDEIFLRVGGQWWPSYAQSQVMRLNDRSPVNISVAFTDSIDVRLVEDDPWPQGNDLIADETVQGTIQLSPTDPSSVLNCAVDVFSSTKVLSDGDATYVLRGTVGPNDQ